MNFFKIALINLLILSLFSCRKVIEVEETDFIGGDIALQTVGNNEQGLIGAYGGLGGTGAATAGLGAEMSILYNAVMSDEVKVGEFYNSATVHEWQFGPTDISIRDQFTAFSFYYRIIDRVNRVLQALPAAQATKAGDEALRSRVKGEALFLRAFCHFELYRYYSGNYDPAGLAMAYMETPSLLPTGRIAMAPYFEKLRSDMDTAKLLVPATLADVTRANKMAVAGLQARVALYMRDWQNANAYSTEFITAVPLATAAEFPRVWRDSSNAGVAFKLKRAAGFGTRIGSIFRATSASGTNIGTVTWSPSNKLLLSYNQTADVRFPTYFKNEPLLAAAGRPAQVITKYAGTAYGTPNENIADFKVFRTAEMYLIRAEARAETGDLVGAAADINAVRANRINPPAPVVVSSKEAAIDAILEERFRELAFEGHRFWDLKRRSRPVQRLAEDAPNANAATLPADNFRFLLPIPQAEIDANPQIQQNPGYSG